MTHQTERAEQTKPSAADRGPWKYMVDERPFESEAPTLSGSQIKARAGIDPSVGLFLEGRGHDSDRPIQDGDIVDFREPGRERLYTMPPATYGSGAVPETIR